MTNIDDGCPPPPAFCTSIGLAELTGPAFADNGATEDFGQDLFGLLTATEGMLSAGMQGGVQ